MSAPIIPAVVYSAKSTDDKNGSIPEQIEDCIEMAEEEGWTIVGEPHKDEDFSAYSGNRGPGLEAAKRAAVQSAKDTGQIVMLVAQAHDRFARGAGDKPGAPQSLGELWHELRRQNVWLRTCEDDEDLRDEASVAAIGRRAHIDSVRKSKSVRKGVKRRAKRGRYIGGRRPFGYVYRDTWRMVGVLARSSPMSQRRQSFAGSSLSMCAASRRTRLLAT